MAEKVLKHSYIILLRFLLKAICCGIDGTSACVVETEKEVQCLIFSNFQDQLEVEWWDIDSVFNKVVTIVEQAHVRALQPLKDRRQVLEKEADNLKKDLEGEISRFKTTISELDDISALEDHVLFLQVRGSYCILNCLLKFC